MRFLITGDWHLSNKRPRSRKDDYTRAMIVKMEEIKHLSLKQGVDAILQPGDLTDDHKFPDKFKTFWIRKLFHFPKIYTVPGQHDLRYHTSPIENTPLGVLREARPIFVGTGQTYNMWNDESDREVDIYTAGWGKDIPELKHNAVFNILITHRMITMDKLWAGQEDYEVAGTFLRKHKFDLIVSGDNHQSFHFKHGNRWLINCGSLMRSTIAQADHKPCVWIFDTEIKEAEQIFLTIEPFEKVMDLDRARREKKIEDQKNESLDKLEEVLSKKSGITGLNYPKRVSNRVRDLEKACGVSPLAAEIIGEVMEDD